MKNCIECNKPLFDQQEADPITQLCDDCWRKSNEEEN